ncbi:MAG: carboxypeptidase-like regulatory domain-containing protein [Sphingobacteriaceae bacterium]|nr:carboxypeptidase-like regulatory domain-containing protein [Sphingobacteriaceae bacterium]
MRNWLIALLLWVATCPIVQAQQLVEGRVLQQPDGQPVAYAGVMANRSGLGTVTNEQGYFRLQLAANDDSLLVRFIGYKTLRIALLSNKNFYELRLEYSVQQLQEVVVVATDESYLYDLLRRSKLQADKVERQARAYFELRTLVGKRQVELVEGFYNARFVGPDAVDLQLKAGRLALQPIENRLFASIQSSDALRMMHTFKSNRYFPTGPFELRPVALKKRYMLLSEGAYRNEMGDSIVVIRFKPKDEARKYFEGRAWVDVERGELLQLQLKCENASMYPFLPLFPDDQIQGVDFLIERAFERQGEDLQLQRLSFEYRVNYANRRGELYKVATKAVLLPYRYEQPFILPRFKQVDAPLSDYMRINAFPYNAAFWLKSDEVRINDQHGENEAFFADKRSLTNVEVFQAGSLGGRALLETPYVRWEANKRLLFSQKSERPQPNDPFKRDVRVDDYHLQVHLFMDLNQLGDSLHWLTATIFDPHQSYFYLPMTNAARCFINMYFDLMEIERRRLEVRLQQSKRTEAAFLETYAEVMRESQVLAERFFKEVMIGNNQKGMMHWNQVIMDALEIDNLAMYKPFEGDNP